MTNGMPRVTVISAYHNRASAVKETIESILTQTFQDLEVLVWDDFSSDDTWTALERFAEEANDPRLTVVRQSSNLGLTSGLNWAISRTHTEYIAVCGSGDICQPQRIAKQVEVLDANPDAPFCATASDTIDIVSGHRFTDNSFDQTVIQFKDIEEVSRFTHGSVMFRRSFLEGAGGYDPTFEWCADWDLFFRLLRDRSGMYIPENLYTRFARLDGVSFHPVKSLSQIRHQGLAKLLARRPDDRSEILQKVRAIGLAQTLIEYGVDISKPAYRRQIKLILMGRHAEAAHMAGVLKKDGIRNLKYVALSKLARGISFLPARRSALISAARFLKRAL